MAGSHNHREGIPARIIERAERRLDRGDTLFPARSIMAGAAIWMFLDDHPEVTAVLKESNAGIVQAMLDRGLEGMVFADRMDLGNGYQDSTDFVAVTALRHGTPTVVRPTIHGEAIVRDATPNAKLLTR